MQNRYLITFSIILLSFTINANGQKQVNSPYSRFILGTMEPAGSFRSIAMGGIATASRDNNSIYFSNPASYSSVDTNSFLFDFGLDYTMNFIYDGVTHYSSDDMNFDHLLLGFPVSKGWGVAAGIIPVSNGYYNLSEVIEEGNPDYDPKTGAYSSIHKGSGGFSNFFIGSGKMINKNFSAGINLSILFGSITRSNQLTLADYYNAFHNSRSEKLQLMGVNFDYGLQYTASLKNEYFINAGVAISSGHYYNSKYELLSLTYSSYGMQDTATYVSDDSTSAYIPGTFRIGVSVGKKNKFTAGIDFVATKWSESRIPGADGYTGNTKALLFGAEYIPDKFSNYGLLKKIEYRIGGHIGENYLINKGKQVKEYGVSAGLGLPMRRSLSKANLFFDYTRKTGPFSADLFKENYYTMGISLNLYDIWFIKRKYD